MAEIVRVVGDLPAIDGNVNELGLCETCRFWQVRTEDRIHNRSCVRHAPIRDPERDRNNEWRQTIWPTTRADDSCGDYLRASQVPQ